MNIDIYHTHIEVSPYKEGDCPEIEKYLSIWNDTRHQYEPMGYIVLNDILYLPRALNLQFIMMKLNFYGHPTFHYECHDKKVIDDSYDMVAFPRNRIQEEACAFMTSKENFKRNSNGSQYMLNLDTSFGKTFAMIHALMHYRMKSLIIVNREKLAVQWTTELIKMTNLPDDKIIFINSSKSMEETANNPSYGYVFVITHQRLQAYTLANGWNKVKEWFDKSEFGIKCFDECHRYFSNTLHIDFFSDTFKTFYLTATYGRTAPSEARIYDIAFRTICRFGEQVSNYEEVRRHINFVTIKFHSYPPIGTSVKGPKGFSNYKYIDYALNEDNQTLLKAYKRVLDQIDRLEGRILVISPKIESTEIIAEFTRNNTNKTCYATHSKKSKEEKELAENADIISTTFGTIGEGLNIKKLRSIIVLQAIGNRINMSQLRGRLREYDDDHDTFIFYLLDTAFTELSDIYRRAVKPVMKQKAKETINVEWYDL